ncbi:MAG: hypothetical protein WED15_10260 [Akkermansiaceae bacterium]
MSLISSLSPLVAQDSNDQEGGIRFRTLGWNLSADDLFYSFKNQDTKVELTESSRSIFHAAGRAKQLTFYRIITGPDDKPMQEVAATVNIETAGPWPLLIFMKDPRSPKRFRVAAIADDLKTFPFPSTQFVNFTGVDMDAKLGDQVVKVAGGGLARIDPRIQAGKESDTRFTAISWNSPAGRRVLYSNNWVVKPNQRTIVFISSQDNRILVMRIRDNIAIYAPRN